MTAMILEQLYGHVTAMTRKTEGSTVTVAASIADTVITVASTGDFDVDFGGQVVLGPDDDIYDYVAVDEDAGTITLSSGLLTALAVDDPVDIYDPEVGGRIVEYVALVLLDEQDPGDEPIEVTVQHGLVNMLSESVRGGIAEAVTLVRDGFDDLMIWQIDGKLAVDVALEAAVSDINVSIDDLLASAELALNLAEASNAVFRQTTAPDPALVTIRTNDTWFDADDSNRPYRWNGSAWVDATQSWLKTNPTSSYPNVVISPAGLVAYSAGGVAVTTISSTDGTITTTGSLWTGGDISGATVTGGTVQSTATASRGVKFNSSGLVAYDSAGTPTFVITGSTGAVTMKGDLTSGSTFTAVGGSVTAVLSGSASPSGSAALSFSGSGFSHSVYSNSGALTMYSNNQLVVTAPTVNIFGVSVTQSATTFLGDITTGSEVHGNRLYAEVFNDGVTVSTATIGASGQVIRTPSTRKAKKNIRNLKADPGAVLALRSVTFQYRDEETFGTAHRPGFIAEEVAEVSEWMVTRDAAGEPSGLNWEAITVHLVETVKALNSRVEELETA